MKKTLLSLALIAGTALSVQAQSFLTQSGSSDTVAVPYVPGEMFVTNYLKSNIGTDISLVWRVNGIDTSSGWHFGGFCDNNLCYGAPGVFTGSYNPTYGTEFGDFHAVFNGDDAPIGSSTWISVRVTDPASGTSRNLVFIAYKSPTGITTTGTAANSVALWPNPATSAVNVSFNPNAGIRYATVYNTIGKVVSQYRVQGNSAKLDVSSLPAGVYMLRLQDGNGKVMSTKRFTRQ